MSTLSPRSRALVGVAGIATLAIALAACSSSSSPSTSPSGTTAPSTTAAANASCGTPTDKDSFVLGTFLPLTGSLAFLAPIAVAGVGEAVDEINDAGGVNGKPVTVVSQDSSDADHANVGQQNFEKLLQANVSAIIGPQSSSVTHNILPTAQGQGTVVFSPSATDDALSGEKCFVRNAAPNSAEGDALAKQILSNGQSKVAVLVFNDAYGINLRDTLESSLKANGGSVTYGAKGAGQEFPSTETSFGSAVSSALGTNPDAVVVIAFDQTKQILPALKSAGWDMSKTYFVDGNLNDYSSDAGVPDLTGAQGTSQGANPDPTFIKKLTDWYSAHEKGKITATVYGAEAYDAAITLALAADLSGKNDSASIWPFIPVATGSQGGDECKSYADCLNLIKGGAKTIHYVGPSGIGAINAKGDPSEAFVSVSEYVGKAPSKFITSVKATIGQ